MACASRYNFNQIKVVALEEVSFLLLEKPRCPLVNQVGDDNSTYVNQHFSCAPQNFFSNGPSTHVYKPLDLDAWPKTRNGKKILHPRKFKLSIL
jgi:hypothetical protein